ncbi:hypothetical protein FORC83_p004 (plasmid) [Campylobacter jejuni]|nr:hypothetical protein FORC83_p004 [Campylobacter jejuni]
MYNVTLVPWADEARGGFLDFDMIFLNGKPYHFRFAVDNYKKRWTGESKLSRPSSVISEMADKMRHIKMLMMKPI